MDLSASAGLGVQCTVARAIGVDLQDVPLLDGVGIDFA